MNSLSGGASVPNATPPQTHPPPPIAPPPSPGSAWPPPPAVRRSLRLRAPREPLKRSRGQKVRLARRAPSQGSPPRGPEAAGRLGASAAASGGASPISARGPARARREKARPGPPPALPARFLALPGPGAPPVDLRTSSSSCTFRASLSARGGGEGRRVRGWRNRVSEAT